MSKRLIGGLVTLVVGIVAILSSIYFLFQYYFDILQGFTNASKNASTVLQLYEQPLFSAFTVIVGLMLIVAAYGYFIERKWAFKLALVATVIGLWTTWMLAMFPLMVGMAPNHMLNFMLIAVAFFTILILEKTELKILLTSFVFGIAYVMTFMNGNASLQKLIGTSLALKKQAMQAGQPFPHVAFLKMNENSGLIYDFIQTANWIGAVIFAVLCIAVIFRKDWVLPVGLVAALISILAGTPVAYLDTVSSKELSMFAYGPIAAVVILVALLVFREKLWSKEEGLFKKVAGKVSSKA